tara:strand:+ start:20972 stop:21685 length:714 start_codon:yes stop_codon:yes gene_type:complete
MIDHNKKAIFFDFDKTLGFIKSHYGIYIKAAQEFGLEISEEKLKAKPLLNAWSNWMTEQGIDHSQHSNNEYAYSKIRQKIATHRLREAGLDTSEQKLNLITKRIVEMEYDPNNYQLYSDTIRCLDYLQSKGFQLLIVSNHIWRLPEIISALKIDSYFSHIITSARIGFRKPHPKIFTHAIELSGEIPVNIIFIGDSYTNDVIGPQQLGLSSILIDREKKRNHANVPTTIIHSLDELR